ncbi:hypothetical protein O53_4032 [Microcystis aeruginosa TAIHU98]|uniref:Uncharacterized protein n=1 Tax=Microcystis aeruginosa TAIHU98 TaxID=1134457 RepID=L7EAA1_MICAE|nr:hypothetical protein O53_4032 [Microcystis aeruginosa TAIHU98]ODV40181.1 hypothetical protein BFG60_0375 [Microcystis aeruginosa NIES-98]
MIGVILSSGNHQFSPFGYLSFLSKWVGVKNCSDIPLIKGGLRGDQRQNLSSI